ncbi:hypothetical protein PF005_g15482 [Phytophthora fragariae]|uniref:Uncharacterized protein n=1 Tax=Phytophthora fragariae TaxID=53985 RepID=A0A6A3M983_9STRA|nr:hypothetical protein PF003_g18330 [Phytophthora fragariae]KAE8935622.1 hypothetical protein PF009_g14451 [Phytophthora fragariae]KAE9026818.1 hypothetical protein PF011_g2372 [Phytophthora fragariae]KAE9105728.1 hypothetical protein PF010_g12895 [Phytophthora fragariae]KAE9106394.1 hypothetical protein PF007_g13424 [Phytophthora fragariae]
MLRPGLTKLLYVSILSTVGDLTIFIHTCTPAQKQPGDDWLKMSCDGRMPCVYGPAKLCVLSQDFV